MPCIYDNLSADTKILTGLRSALEVSHKSDFCVGYFNLRGWRAIDDLIEPWHGASDSCCRLLVGMSQTARERLNESYHHRQRRMDQGDVARLKTEAAREFRQQLCVGIPTAADEAGLRRLAAQLRAGKVQIKLHLRHPLHAKLYLAHRHDKFQPILAFLGSSNLTFSGLSGQGELNIDVADRDNAGKLLAWFNDRWDDAWSKDISAELIDIIEESWAGEKLIPPHHIYLKMAWHLSQDARDGVREFRLPYDLQRQLQEFQQKAVQIACQHLNRRNGVIVGDVVGLGKTRIASAIARVIGDDQCIETLILCPKNLKTMWDDYVHRFRIRGARIVAHSEILPLFGKGDFPRYRLVIIDESHNFRNREGKRYAVLREYLRRNESKVILLSATPYNKSFLDLSNQLRLFLDEKADLGIRPESLFKELAGAAFSAKFPNVPPSSLEAFEKSEHLDDWRELMRLFLVRRTRSFIINNYAETDAGNGRKFLTLENGLRSYFPDRKPTTIRFPIHDQDPADQYAQLFSPSTVSVINNLSLPRYGLGQPQYLKDSGKLPKDLTAGDLQIIEDLSRAGNRLMGFCRTNLYKRLESTAHAFILSLHRHLIRNHVFLHAIASGKPIPIGEQDPALLDSGFTDSDELNLPGDPPLPGIGAWDEAHYQRRAAEIYQILADSQQKNYRWLRPDVFKPALAKALALDAQDLLAIMQQCGPIAADRDEKLQALLRLVREHPKRKFILFSQFADTIAYLAEQFKNAGVSGFAPVTGDTENPAEFAHAFSPDSNEQRRKYPPEKELRILLATDVLSEGQNLQDAHAIINFDIPWAIIRLIQRAGRVDRIGQSANTIHCYTFLPADGVERIIKLRQRITARLQQNREVVGSDEEFFENQTAAQLLDDLYNEKSGILDEDAADTEVDLVSEAYEIWAQAVKHDPALRKKIEALPDVVHSTKAHTVSDLAPGGALVYVKTSEQNNALAWLDADGQVVTESQYRILKAAACDPDTPALPRQHNHYTLVEQASRLIVSERKSSGGGQLGPRTGARYRAYDRLQHFLQQRRDDLFLTDSVKEAVQAVYNHPLTQHAADALNRQLRSGINDDALAAMVAELHRNDRLVIRHEYADREQPAQIICSMGLAEV